MTKLLRQSINHRTKLRDKCLKNPCGENSAACESQRNTFLNLSRYEKRRYFNNLNLTCLKDNGTFWRTIKLRFSEKSAKCTKIVLVKDDDAVCDNIVRSKTMNNFFL